MSSTREVEATIDELAAGGDGVALVEHGGERRAIFVPSVATGERVKVATDFAKRPARGRLLAVLSPSPGRVRPACPHHHPCGACDWMHLDLSTQQAEHARLVGRHLGAAVTRSWPPPLAVGYRVRARVHLVARGSRVICGMFAPRTHLPVAAPTCLVLHPAVDRTRTALEGWLAGAQGRGEARLALGSPSATGDDNQRRAVIDLDFDGELPAQTFARFERALGDGVLDGVRVRLAGATRPAVIGDPSPFVVGADDAPLRLAPGGFSQASEAGNRALAARVTELAGSAPDGECVELYAGAGNLTVVLSRTRSVTAVEGDAEAADAARDNLRARGLSARVVVADASRFDIPRATKVLVLDPPRQGARLAVEQVARARRVPVVVYVSCDPPTLGRDVRCLLGSGYRLTDLETFEMFPHTSHVETVARLEARPP